MRFAICLLGDGSGMTKAGIVDKNRILMRL